MNSQETTTLVALIHQLWPAMKINDATPDAWYPALGDLTADCATTAVYALAKSHRGYIGIADIRYQAADNAGLLPVEQGIAYDMAARVGLASGVGAGMLPGPVQDAYWQMGGAPAFEGEAAMVRSRWNKIYAACCEKHTKELLAGNLGAAIAVASIASRRWQPIESGT